MKIFWANSFTQLIKIKKIKKKVMNFQKKKDEWFHGLPYFHEKSN